MANFACRRSVTFLYEVDEALERISEETNITVLNIIREAVKEYVDKKGIVKSSPVLKR